MCEWTRERELLKNFLRILSEWFTKHLEISLGAIPRGFESHPLRHVGAKSALLRRLFMHEAKKTSSARSLAPPFQLRPAALGSRLVCCPAGHIPISAAPHESASGARGKVHNFCRRSSTLSWAIRLLDRRFFSVINCEASSSSNAWKALCHTGAAFREPAGGASR